ncbi:hypothetical protein DPEC_G00361980 [Dallia pectoralis]|nr:hypothetical protein DPEC_G00361980 [Dallia pectoralis]
MGVSEKTELTDSASDLFLLPLPGKPALLVDPAPDPRVHLPVLTLPKSLGLMKATCLGSVLSLQVLVARGGAGHGGVYGVGVVALPRAAEAPAGSVLGLNVTNQQTPIRQQQAVGSPSVTTWFPGVTQVFTMSRCLVSHRKIRFCSARPPLPLRRACCSSCTPRSGRRPHHDPLGPGQWHVYSSLKSMAELSRRMCQCARRL